MDTQWILFWWARNMVSQMTAWQEEAKRKHDEQLAKNSETEWQNLYLAWLNATDPKAQQQNFTGANAINVWKIIAQAAKDHWSDSYDWLEPNQAISNIQAYIQVCIRGELKAIRRSAFTKSL